MAVLCIRNNDGGNIMNEIKELYFGNATLYLEDDEKE
jgi:hypothetical protein